jgi:glycerophosphoryl diester phosphodiesterase
VCGVQGGVHEFTLEQLRQFHASEFDRFGYKFANTPIATLAELCELLQRHPRVTAFIEVKQDSLDQFGIALTLKHIANELYPIAKQCVLISFSNELLLTARKAQQKGWHALGVVVEKWRERKRDIIQSIKPEYLFCDARGLPWFGRLHLDGAQLVVYEITDTGLALRLAERGAALIETFAVGEMLAKFELIRGAAA